MTYLSASTSSSDLFGVLGTGGLAIVLTTVLVIGIRGRGKLRLTQTAASITGFLAGVAYTAAGSIWANAGTVTKQALAGAASPHGPAGDVGLGAIAIVLTLVMVYARVKPGIAAVLGIAAATVFAAAGGIWAIATTTAATTFVSFGLQ